MSKKTRGVMALVALCGLSLFLLNCGTSVNRSSGLLYVLSQGTSAVSSYSISLTSGALSLINSNAKTCTTAPCGLPVNILLDPTGATAFVLNQGVFTPADANQGVAQSGSVPSVYGYTVNSDGSLAVKGDLTTSSPPPLQNNCTQPPTVQGVFAACDLAVAMTRDAAGKFLFVITGGNQASSPTMPPQLYVFNMQAGSTTLALASQLALTRIPTGLAAINDPNSSNILLYVTSNKDLSSNLVKVDNALTEYTVDATSGALKEYDDPNTGFPYTTGGNPNAVVAVKTAPVGGNGGVFVYVAGGTSNSVGAYQLCTLISSTCTSDDVTKNFKLVPVGTPPNAGANPIAMVADPTSQFLYVVSENSSQVFGFRINATQGTLSALSPANLSTGGQPIAIAMHSTGKFLFVSNNGSSNVSAFAVDTLSGSMSSPSVVANPGQPAGLVSR